LNAKQIKEWMESLLARFGAEWAVSQILIEIYEDEESKSVEINFVVSPEFKGQFNSTQFMETVSESIKQYVKTGRLSSLEDVTVVIRQDVKFSIGDIKEEIEKRKRRQRMQAASS